MKIKLNITILVFIIFSNVYSQKNELGFVSIAELEEKFHPIDTSAAAAILFKKGQTFFTYNSKSGFSANHIYEFRIKIYKKRRFKLGKSKSFVLCRI